MKKRFTEEQIIGFLREAEAVVYRSFCKFRFGRWQEVLPGGRPGRVAPGAAARQSGTAVA